MLWGRESVFVCLFRLYIFDNVSGLTAAASYYVFAYILSAATVAVYKLVSVNPLSLPSTSWLSQSDGTDRLVLEKAAFFTIQAVQLTERVNLSLGLCRKAAADVGETGQQLHKFLFGELFDAAQRWLHRGADTRRQLMLAKIAHRRGAIRCGSFVPIMQRDLERRTGAVVVDKAKVAVFVRSAVKLGDQSSAKRTKGKSRRHKSRGGGCYLVKGSPALLSEMTCVTRRSSISSRAFSTRLGKKKSRLCNSKASQSPGTQTSISQWALYLVRNSFVTFARRGAEAGRGRQASTLSFRLLGPRAPYFCPFGSNPRISWRSKNQCRCLQSPCDSRETENGEFFCVSVVSHRNSIFALPLVEGGQLKAVERRGSSQASWSRLCCCCWRTFLKRVFCDQRRVTKNTRAEHERRGCRRHRNE